MSVWRCVGCGVETPDRVRRCACRSGILYKRASRETAMMLEDPAPRIRFVAEAICAFRNRHVAPSLRCTPEDWIPVAKAAVEAADAYAERSNSL